MGIKRFDRTAYRRLSKNRPCTDDYDGFYYGPVTASRRLNSNNRLQAVILFY